MIKMNVKSVSKSIYPKVTDTKFCANILAAFNNSCDLETRDGEIIALVNPEVGNGPFHLVLEAPTSFSDWEMGLSIHGDGEMLWVDKNIHHQMALSMENAQIWDPMPDWKRLRNGKNLPVNLAKLNQILRNHAPEESLAGSGKAEWKDAAHRAISDIIKNNTQGDINVLSEALRALCGIGPGLTPSGDDWLAGWLLGLKLKDVNSNDIKSVRGVIINLAKERTTRISQAFLNAATRGEVVESWHMLLEALTYGDKNEVRKAAIEVMDFGATSGADMLAGFVAVFI